MLRWRRRRRPVQDGLRPSLEQLGEPGQQHRNCREPELEHRLEVSGRHDVIKGGQVSWQPAVNPERMVLTSGIVAFLVLIALRGIVKVLTGR